jgi:hypothetical protein
MKLIIISVLFWSSLSRAQEANLGNVLAAFLGGQKDEGCSYMCPDRTKPSRARDGHIPSSNGCGTAGFQVDPEFGFSPCCDEHDMCYDTCGSDRDTCDKKFEKCLKATCDALPIPTTPALEVDETEDVSTDLLESAGRSPSMNDMKSTADVALFLKKHGFGEHARALADNNVDGDVLFTLTEKDLKEMGVRKLGDRRKLLTFLTKQRAELTPAPVVKKVVVSRKGATPRKAARTQGVSQTVESPRHRCHDQASMFSGMSSMFGCAAWRSAQEGACHCKPHFRPGTA